MTWNKLYSGLEIIMLHMIEKEGLPIVNNIAFKCYLQNNIFVLSKKKKDKEKKIKISVQDFDEFQFNKRN